jgi:NADH:ubiquinone oxidoreductase subunit 6 (subunit J)
MIESVVFGGIAAIMVCSALCVVLWRNLVHSVLWLAALLLATAALFVLLRAPFLGGVQVMLYAGGVVTLMLFGIMLTRRSGGVAVENETAGIRRLPAALASSALFGAMVWAIQATDNLPLTPARPITTRDLARAFLTQHVLAFEVLSVLLLAATVGAIVIARRTDHGAPSVALKRRSNHSRRMAK